MVSVFDTSALIAAHILTHPQFAWADEQLQIAQQPAICSHSLAEFYSVVTASPQIRLPPAQAVRLLENLEANWTVLPGSTADYLRAVRRCQVLGLQGGAIFDTLLAEVSLHASASALITLNPRHFRRLGADIEQLVVAPF